MALRRTPNAQPIVVGAITATGPVTQEDRVLQDASGAETLIRATVAQVPTATFVDAPITRHSTVTIGTTSYRVRDVRLVDDGAVTEVVLAEVLT